jgi:hypothetical protein
MASTRRDLAQRDPILVVATAQGCPASAKTSASNAGMRRVQTEKDQVRWQAALHPLRGLLIW